VASNTFQDPFTLMETNKISSIDCYPCDFKDLTETFKLKCVRPLFIQNQMSMLTPVIKTQRYSSLINLSRIYDSSVWLTLIAILIFLSFITTFKMKYINKDKGKLYLLFGESLWIYFKTLLDKGDQKKFITYSYLFWLISILPVIEIYKNELFAKIVLVSERRVDTIDDIIADGSITVTINEKDLRNLRKESVKTEDDVMREKINKLVSKTITLNADIIFNYIENVSEMKNRLKRVTILEDEYSMRWLYGWTSIHVKTRVASQSYFPSMITPMCFNQNYTHIEFTNKMLVFL
jgi:hypothetical protein